MAHSSGDTVHHGSEGMVVGYGSERMPLPRKEMPLHMPGQEEYVVAFHLPEDQKSKTATLTSLTDQAAMTHTFKPSSHTNLPWKPGGSDACSESKH